MVLREVHIVNNQLVWQKIGSVQYFQRVSDVDLNKSMERFAG
jgi:hypothetical protein